MNIVDAIKQRVLKFLGLEKLVDNPNSARYEFIHNKDNIIAQNVEEYKVWYVGDGDELLNYYMNFNVKGKYSEATYNRNRSQYFWATATKEDEIKRVHSGVPNAIVTTLVNAIGSPKITMDDAGVNEVLSRIMDKNDFTNFINQQQMPMTMVEGWGAVKINIDKELCDVPLIEYYEAQDVDFIYKSNILLGIVYRDYYTNGKNNYVLFETRRIAGGDSYIEFELFKIDRNDNLVPCEFREVPELKDFDGETLVIKGFKHILGVPSKFFFDPNNKNYGRSVYAGKIDNFDELDQILSQKSTTVKVSTPVEYIPSDLIERNKNGTPMRAKLYNRQFVAIDGIPDGDGKMNSQIQTTQPQMNIDQYDQAYRGQLDVILTGFLSPATMGIEVAKKDNAEAQREKEKITIMTRNNIIARETTFLKELCCLLLYAQEYMNTGHITLVDHDVSVTFDEFANPSFEDKLETLGGAWKQGYISDEMYIDLLWGDKLSDEGKATELLEIKTKAQQDNLSFGQLGSDINEPSDNYQQEEGITEEPSE